MTLGEQIRAGRLEKGLSLPAMSRLTNVSIGHLSNVERNIRPISLRVLRAIRNALDAPLDARQDIQPRQFKVDLSEVVGDGAERSGDCRVAELRRSADGEWCLTLDYDYEFALPDGRKVRFAGRRAIRGIQHGRKPRSKRAS